MVRQHKDSFILTSSRFCVLCVRTNHFEAHLVVSPKRNSKRSRLLSTLDNLVKKRAKWRM